MAGPEYIEIPAEVPSWAQRAYLAEMLNAQELAYKQRVAEANRPPDWLPLALSGMKGLNDYLGWTWEQDDKRAAAQRQMQLEQAKSQWSLRNATELERMKEAFKLQAERERQGREADWLGQGFRAAGSAFQPSLETVPGPPQDWVVPGVTDNPYLRGGGPPDLLGMPGGPEPSDPLADLVSGALGQPPAYGGFDYQPPASEASGPNQATLQVPGAPQTRVRPGARSLSDLAIRAATNPDLASGLGRMAAMPGGRELLEKILPSTAMAGLADTFYKQQQGEKIASELKAGAPKANADLVQGQADETALRVKAKQLAFKVMEANPPGSEAHEQAKRVLAGLEQAAPSSMKPTPDTMQARLIAWAEAEARAELLKKGVATPTDEQIAVIANKKLADRPATQNILAFGGRERLQSELPLSSQPEVLMRMVGPEGKPVDSRLSFNEATARGAVMVPSVQIQRDMATAAGITSYIQQFMSLIPHYPDAKESGVGDLLSSGANAVRLYMDRKSGGAATKLEALPAQITRLIRSFQDTGNAAVAERAVTLGAVPGWMETKQSAATRLMILLDEIPKVWTNYGVLPPREFQALRDQLKPYLTPEVPTVTPQQAKEELIRRRQQRGNRP